MVISKTFVVHQSFLLSRSKNHISFEIISIGIVFKKWNTPGFYSQTTDVMKAQFFNQIL